MRTAPLPAECRGRGGCVATGVPGAQRAVLLPWMKAFQVAGPTVRTGPSVTLESRMWTAEGWAATSMQLPPSPSL